MEAGERQIGASNGELLAQARSKLEAAKSVEELRAQVEDLKGLATQIQRKQEDEVTELVEQLAAAAAEAPSEPAAPSSDGTLDDTPQGEEAAARSSSTASGLFIIIQRAAVALIAATVALHYQAVAQHRDAGVSLGRLALWAEMQNVSSESAGPGRGSFAGGGAESGGVLTGAVGMIFGLLGRIAASVLGRLAQGIAAVAVVPLFLIGVLWYTGILGGQPKAMWAQKVMRQIFQ
mmetsp:Transcript_149645/g.276038  ORF Transcript_149645/g.276038 Transcript_149645/m.276038 type:complete len:234 (-) Transcript_149645:37-738(-)